MKIVMALSVLCFSLGAIPAAIACTQQEAMQKGNQLSQLIQAKMAKDPSQAQALMAKLQPIMMANQQTGATIDWDKVCTQYDAMIVQAQ
jgi:hypothetical protein